MISLPATTAVALILGFAARRAGHWPLIRRVAAPIWLRLGFVAVLTFQRRRTGAPVRVEGTDRREDATGVHAS